MTYWNGNGKYQKEYNEIQSEIPAFGKANEQHIELLRNATNLYYDHYNNQNCNWSTKKEQFDNIAENAGKLLKISIDEGSEIHSILSNIHTELDRDLEDGEFYLGKNSKNLNQEFENLLDIVTMYASVEKKNKKPDTIETKPEKLEELKKLCQKYIDDKIHGELNWYNIESDVFECAIELFFGEEIWDWLNK